METTARHLDREGPQPLERQPARSPAADRVASAVAGGTLGLVGIGRRTPAGVALVVIGGTLVYRGATGHWPARLGLTGLRRMTRALPAPRPIIFPTGYMAAEFCDIEPGDTVAVWGCGPVGQFAVKSAFLLGAERVIAIDKVPERL